VKEGSGRCHVFFVSVGDGVSCWWFGTWVMGGGTFLPGAISFEGMCLGGWDVVRDSILI
jgi:hypothetical protein